MEVWPSELAELIEVKQNGQPQPPTRGVEPHAPRVVDRDAGLVFAEALRPLVDPPLEHRLEPLRPAVVAGARVDAQPGLEVPQFSEPVLDISERSPIMPEVGRGCGVALKSVSALDVVNPAHRVASPAGRIVPVILSGGSGTRLWPVSRESYPKQYWPLISERSLIEETDKVGATI